MSKIFVRERRHVGQGAGRPRFAVVAVEGVDLKIYTPHIRKIELENLAESIGLEIVYLPRGEQEGTRVEQAGGHAGRRQRRRSDQD
jgi:hypothetical protein